MKTKIRKTAKKRHLEWLSDERASTGWDLDEWFWSISSFLCLAALGYGITAEAD
jgi:hypothetical protein